jgi:NAD(P)-dependent dehydrogenase (short-subunit alcohol dehydrogenase family)
VIDLSGQSLLVVGGGSGIGLSVAEEAVALGAVVTVADSDPAVAGFDTGPGAAIDVMIGDATVPGDMAKAVAHAAARTGRLDGVLTTVGGARLGTVDGMTLDVWRAELDFNLTSAFVVCKEALRVLRAQRGGAIVTTSSGYASIPGPDRAAYTAAKSGVIALSRSLAAAAAADGVRVNCVAPGPTDTPRFRSMNGGDVGVDAVRRAMPMGRIPRPIDVARVALFLVSDAAREVTGQVIHVNGGLIMT